MLESLFTWLLLPLGAVLGWVLARRAPPIEPSPDGSEQLGGLAPGVADADQAIQALTQTAVMDNSAAELHLTLGKFFRKNGEVDRALRIHQALSAHPQVSADFRNRARFELAQDYLKAGLIDRAEEILGELVEQGLLVVPALEQILGIYEQGRDWAQAIETAQRLQASKGESRHAVIAQYFCELADEERQRKNNAEAIKYAKQALDTHKQCVRANLLLGGLYLAQGDFVAAIKAYRKVFDQDPRFLSEVMTPIAQCYEKSGDAAGYMSFLADAKEVTPSALPVVAEARLMREEGMDAMSHLAAGLETRPSRAVLIEFLEVMEKKPDVIAAGLDRPAASLRGALRRLMETSPRYQCSQCGFNPRQMFWQCPTCKQWSTIAPVEDVLKPAG